MDAGIRAARPSPEILPDALIFLRIAVPDNVTVATVRRARRSGAPACLAARAAWRAVGTAAVFRVPSAVVPIADKIVLDPTHPDAGRCAIVKTIPYVFERWFLDPIRR